MGVEVKGAGDDVGGALVGGGFGAAAVSVNQVVAALKTTGGTTTA